MNQWKFSLILKAENEIPIKKVLNLLFRACYEDERIPPECERFWRIVSLEGNRKREINKDASGSFFTFVRGISKLPFKKAFNEFPYSSNSSYSKTLIEDLMFLGVEAEITEEDMEGNRKYFCINKKNSRI